uniref:Uncharacterized protein n=1 Tax=Rhizophora mucronata TaxID=61149 RepID=A0A2P2R037_RHIMU
MGCLLFLSALLLIHPVIFKPHQQQQKQEQR